MKEKLHEKHRSLSVSITLRIIAQTLSVIFFVALFFTTDSMHSDDIPFHFYFSLDPFHALTVIFSTGTWIPIFGWAVGLLGATFIFGRFFCGWICPLGSIFQFFRWISLRTAKLLTRIPGMKVENQKSWFGTWVGQKKFKYYLLVLFLVISFFSVNLSGILDPQSILYRSLLMTMYPWLASQTEFFSTHEVYFWGGWMFAAMFLALLIANLKEPRWFCRKFCPLGALLGLAAKTSIFRIHNKNMNCTECSSCNRTCEGDANPGMPNFDVSECYVCMKCPSSCTHTAIGYGLHLPGMIKPVPEKPSRRLFVSSAISGIVGGITLIHSPIRALTRQNQLIRPPGALAEKDFTDTCVRCGICVKGCPSNVLQFAWLEADLEGLWTPYLDYTIHYCQPMCTTCSQVCPTKAIRPISSDEKLGKGEFSSPIKIGTAFFDTNVCIPYSSNGECHVCEEVCPVSPKAIRVRETMDGKRLPYVIDSLCIGCGACQYHCPIRNPEGVRVHAFKETRHTFIRK